MGEVLAADAVARKLGDRAVLAIDHGDDFVARKGRHRFLVLADRTGST